MSTCAKLVFALAATMCVAQGEASPGGKVSPGGAGDAHAQVAPLSVEDGDIAFENTQGLPKDVSLAAAVATFNARERRSARATGRKLQPPLSADEVLTAIYARLALHETCDGEGSPCSEKALPKEVQSTYFRIVKKKVLPKGSRLSSERGWSSARPLGPDSAAMDIQSYAIYLDILMDKYPPGPGLTSPAPHLLVRLQHLGTKPAAPLK